ncbi:alpha/beta fold hydrolase [Prescottella defluvii]|nr:alpha/beta fold hydrolase [Prescottella defluvii]
MIVLHGGPGTPGEGIPSGGDELADAGFDVYAYDQVGAGRSSRLTDVRGYTVERQVEDLEDIRETLGPSASSSSDAPGEARSPRSIWPPTQIGSPRRSSLRRERSGAVPTRRTA